MRGSSAEAGSEARAGDAEGVMGLPGSHGSPARGGAAAYGIALISGAVLTLAFPEPDLAPAAWVAVAPLFVLVREATPRRGFGLGVVYGVGFFGTLLFWQSLLGWIAWGLLVGLEAVFIGVWGALWAVASRRGGHLAGVLVPAILWVAVEYLRSLVPLGGFTWGQLAQSQHDLAWMLRPAAYTGAWGVTLLVALANGALAEAWRISTSHVPRRTARAAALAAAAVILVAAPALLPAQSAGGREARIAIVQGNVPRDFEGSFFDKELGIIASHARLTAGLREENPDLVIWPESSVGIDPYRYPKVSRSLAEAARAVSAPMLVGGEVDVGSRKRKVVVFLVTPEGRIADLYQKRHHVPFGEYIPARRFLDWIPMLDQVPTDSIPGQGPKVFTLAGGPVAPVISFEGDFGSLVRQSIDAGGRLLVVATNTSTYGFTWNSAQHVAFSQLRAAENGVWVAHAALSGISAFIAPDGAVAHSTPLWVATTALQRVRFSTGATFYARTGDWLPLGCAVAGLGGVLFGAAARKDPDTQES
ncbi:MAG: apolipoprotein N-acyltransferase [Actinomycetota bacterium]|nr:apolipoprotein N-acyltransferase [Actinomycetota bacterium]